MRTLMIGLALFALIVAARAQTVDPQQQAIEQRRATIKHCQTSRDADLRAGVRAQEVQQMYQKCLQMADENYDRALRAAGLQGNTSQCTRPDGCGAPPGGFKPDPKKPAVPGECPAGAGCRPGTGGQ